MSLQDSMIRAAALNAFNEANKMARDPLFQQDIKENIAAVGRGARTLPVSLAGGAGDLAYMAVNPFLQLVGQGLRPEESFGTTEYLSNIPAVRELIGQEEDSLPYQAGAVLPLLALANVPDTAEMVGKALPELTNKINSFISDIPKDFAAITPEGSMFRVTETPRKINKKFPQGTEPTDSYAAIVKKSPPGFATLDPEGGAYWENDQWLNIRTGKDVGEGLIQNAIIGVDFKKPNVLDATGKPKTKVFMKGGDVINQDIAYLDYKKAAGKNTKSSGIDEIEINLRKSDTFGEAAWLGGKFPKGMENQSIVSLVTKPRYSDNFSKNQHFYTVKTNVIGQGYLKKGAKAEQELMAKTDYTYTGGKKKGQPITEREQRKRITQNPRAKVLVTGEVTIDTRKSNIIGHIKKTPQGKTKEGVPILEEIQKLTAQGKHKDAQKLARGEVSEKTANLKYDDNNIMYYPVYKEVWVDGKDLPL